MNTLWLTYGTRTVVEDCEDAWDDRTGGSVTCSADTGIYVVGSKSAKMLTGGTISANTKMASETISSADYSALTHLIYWVRSSAVAAAGGLQIMLDDTGDCASPIETINCEAIPYANQWYRHCIPLATPASDTAIISVGLKAGTDTANGVSIYLDDIEATTAKSFQAYSIRGIDRPDEIETFPGVSGTLLDGSGYEMIHSWRRTITLDLHPLTSPTDINFLINWALSSSKYVVYGSDDIPVMLEDATRLANEWMGGVDLFRRWTLRLIEKTARTTVPSSWGYSI